MRMGRSYHIHILAYSRLGHGYCAVFLRHVYGLYFLLKADFVENKVVYCL